MAYRIAGIDVHKKMLAVVVADVEGESEYQFERRQFGTTPDHLRLLSEWFVKQEVEEVVMESTTQYWKPVRGAFERYWKPSCQKREAAGSMSGALHLLNQCVNAAVKTKGSIFEIVYRPLVTTPGTQSDHWGNCPSALSADLDHLAPSGPLRGTHATTLAAAPRGCRPLRRETACLYLPFRSARSSERWLR